MKHGWIPVWVACSLGTAWAVQTPVAHLERDVNGTLNMSWGAVPNADSYAVYQWVVPYQSSQLLVRVGGGQTAVEVPTGAAGFYYVVAEGEDVVSPPAAPTPTVPAEDVISLFSNAYDNVAVGTWSTGWDAADVADVQLDGNDTKLYTNLLFAGIEFTAPTIEATAMNRFHMDVWTPDATAAPAFFRVKLVDFGADGAYGGGDDTEHELLFNDASTPQMVTGQWVSIDVPLAQFTGLVHRGHLAQMILSSSSDPALSTVYVDNVYLWDDGTIVEPPAQPTVAAPTPTVPAEDVLSLFSNAYTNHPVDSWSMPWDVADVGDVQIAGNDTKHYINMNYAGIEFANPPADATDMTRFHMDIWTPLAVDPPVQFGIKLVDWGANGVWGGGDDVEHMVWLNNTSVPALASQQWVSIDLPLSQFGGLITRGHVAQMIIQGLGEVYVDNVYFWDDGSVVEPPAGPTSPAPLPTYPASDVISLFSNAYNNVTVDTWSTVWDQAAVEDVLVAGDAVKKYTGLVFAGIETVAQQIDATGMTHFRLDYWTPDPTGAPAVFRIKLVDFGADGAWSGGDDVEHELSFTSTSTPALQSGTWVTFDLPLDQFTNLVTRGHMAQLIISGTTTTAYIDNVLFHR